MVTIKLDSSALEKVLLAIFLAILFFIGPGLLFGNKIKHDFPYAYSASDAFQHQVRAEAIKDAGNFRHEAPYIAKSFERTIAMYPPMIYHLAAIFSYLAGIEVYDSIYFITFFFAILSVLVMYLIIRDFNKNIALMSLPLAILMFTYPLMIGFTWGHWPSLLAQFFLAAFAWCMMKIELEKSYILAALIFSSIIFAHTSEAVFALIFAALFFGIRLLSGSLRKNEIKSVITAFAISFVISLYYLIIFKITWFKGQPYSFAVEPAWQGNPGFYILDFGALLAFIVMGIAFSLFRLKNMHASFILAFAMLIGGHLNYIGFGLRSFQVRFFWPIYFAVFFGAGIYILLKPAVKKWNMAYTISLLVILTILLTGLIKIPLVPHYNKAASQGIMDPYHWPALSWISKNAESNSKIYFFYGDIYSQDALLRNSKRIHYLVDPDDFVKAIQDKKIKRMYVSELPGDNGGGIWARTGLFSSESLMESKPSEYFFGPQDICRFDYIVFDKASRQQVLAQYNLLIASELLKKGMTKAFENEVVVILKNNNIGGDCIEERSF